MKLNVGELGLKEISRHEPPPGMTEGVSDKACPACMFLPLSKIKPCCGAKKGMLLCPKCGYKEVFR